LHEIQTAETCQTDKCDRNEIITVAKILLTNQMVLIVNCVFRISSLLGAPNEDDFVWIPSNLINDFVWFSRAWGQAFRLKQTRPVDWYENYSKRHTSEEWPANLLV